jgi:hypothetical protein
MYGENKLSETYFVLKTQNLSCSKSRSNVNKLLFLKRSFQVIN